MKKMCIILAAVVALFVGVVCAQAQNLDGVTYLTEDYPPFNFDEGGKLKGISIDMLTAAFKQAGASKKTSDVQLVPWANGYDRVQKEPNICLFAMTRTEAREKLFKWAGPIAKVEIVVIGRKGKIAAKSVADLKNYTIGVVREDVGQQLLVEGGYPADKLDISPKSESLIKKLEAGRIDGIAYDKAVGFYMMKKSGLNTADYEPAYVLKSGEVFYAFSKGTDDAVVAAFQKALDAVKASGEAQKIIDSYK